MTLTKRIIPCLDILDGQTVKGVNFENLIHAGDPVELGARYAKEGADELVYLDITATYEKRKLFIDLVKRVAGHLSIPFIVGGGINELSDAEKLLSAGANKISINSSAAKNPEFIEQLSGSFGSKFVIVAIDAKLEGNVWRVYVNGGRVPIDKELFSWAKEAQERGAGEILFTSMSHDGTREGYPCETLAILSDNLSIPVIASGGAGKPEHFVEVFTKGKADAALAAGIFHFNEISIPVLKEYLRKNNIPVK